MKPVIVACLVLCVLVASVASYPECSEGQRKTLYCNRCYCSRGHWDCTRRSCGNRYNGNNDYNNYNGYNDYNRRPRSTKCTPGTTFQQDCNTCVCSQDGTEAACTLKACL